MGSRRVWFVVALSIVMLEAGFPQRGEAQRRAELLPGARFGPPLRAGVALGVVYGSDSSFAEFAGPIAIAEAGIGGGRVSAGYLLAFPFVSGVEVLGTAVRTWGSPSQVRRKTTLAGGELRLSMFAVNVGLGVFKPVRPDDGNRRTRYYMNVGLGI